MLYPEAQVKKGLSAYCKAGSKDGVLLSLERAIEVCKQSDSEYLADSNKSLANIIERTRLAKNPTVKDLQELSDLLKVM